MSVEAIAWVLNHAPVKSPVSKLVLVALANHARPDGSAAFPSVGTICRYTCLSERAVRAHLDALEGAGVIERCDPTIVAAHVKRADRRPVGYNICLGGVQEAHLVPERGAAGAGNGVQEVPLRGAGDAPKPYKNHPMNQARECAAYLEQALQANTPAGGTPPKDDGRWAGVIGRLLERGATADFIKTAINVAMEDAFYRRNIRTALGLVRHWDRLALDVQGKQSPNKRGPERVDSLKTTILVFMRQGYADAEIAEFIGNNEEFKEALEQFWQEQKVK